MMATGRRVVRRLPGSGEMLYGDGKAPLASWAMRGKRKGDVLVDMVAIPVLKLKVLRLGKLGNLGNNRGLHQAKRTVMDVGRRYFRYVIYLGI